MTFSRLFAVLFFGVTCLPLSAQRYQTRQYRVEHGLPSDVVKAVAQDPHGFIWIATDDGLVKYDGLQFTTYKQALHSPYAKAFLRTRKGKFYAIGDLDLIEINNNIDTVTFRSVLKGARSAADSTIWYPKSIYEDREGNLWLGEPQSVVRYNGNSFRRFDFGPTNRSIVFIRSFALLDDDDFVFAFSYNGKVFRIDKATDAVTELKTNFPDRVTHALLKGDELLVATGEGVFSAKLHAGEITGKKLLFAIENASHLYLDEDASLWIGTFGDNFYHRKTTGEMETIPYAFKGINSFYRSDEGDFWMATDKGMVLVQPNQFIVPDTNSLAHFVEGMAYDSLHDTFYYCTKETLTALHPDTVHNTYKAELIFQNNQSYFQALQVGRKGLWASVDFRVLLFQNKKVAKTFDFTAAGNFVHDIHLDKEENLWVCQADNTYISMISPDFQLRRFPIALEKQSEINLARHGSKGIYAVGSGSKAYLFLKATGTDHFTDISAVIQFPLQSDLNIVDMAVGKDDDLWMASTDGLLLFRNNQIQRVDLGETFSNLSVSSVEMLDNSNLLFSNSHGLFRYNTSTGDYWLYDEHAGLPSNTITDQGILPDHHGRLWIGTSYGVGLAESSIITQQKTPRPYCVKARINGVYRRYQGGLTADHGAYINLQFSSITFPENKIYMQWRIPGIDSTWRTLNNRELSLNDLPSRQHTIEIRAKKNTGLDWSEPLVMTLTIEKPYWQQPNFVLLVLLGVLFMMWLSYLLSARVARSRRTILQNLVNQRTRDLQKANEELQQRNDELDRFVYSTSHDLSAPLKSLLGLISVARLDSTAQNMPQYLTMMERSVRKLEDFIHEVVAYSRNTRLPLRWEVCEFEKFARGILSDHQYSPDYDRIHFDVSNHCLEPFVTDVTRLKIILNNLVSNAIKFQFKEDPDRKSFVRISLNSKPGYYVITIEDNGKGIEPRHLNHIFDMFYRANEYAQGSGLGLYILKESVLKLGGTVEASSQLGHGTRFLIILPTPSASHMASLVQGS